MTEQERLCLALAEAARGKVTALRRRARWNRFFEPVARTGPLAGLAAVLAVAFAVAPGLVAAHLLGANVLLGALLSFVVVTVAWAVHARRSYAKAGVDAVMVEHVAAELRGLNELLPRLPVDRVRVAQVELHDVDALDAELAELEAQLHREPGYR